MTDSSTWMMDDDIVGSILTAAKPNMIVLIDLFMVIKRIKINNRKDWVYSHRKTDLSKY